MLTLVLGGTRSGKSAVAERLAAGLPSPITYVATAVAGDDAELAGRIAAHRARRPASWRTVEAGIDLIAALRATAGSVLVDSLGTWLALHHDLSVDQAGLVTALEERVGDTVVVSEEVGWSVHPTTEAGRRFVDTIGDLNQAVAEIADRVLLVVAGRVLALDRPEG